MDAKYKKITKEELDNIVKLDARLFIGNTLCFYSLKLHCRGNDKLMYVTSNDYDKLLKQYGITLDDKSNIPRISFSTPSGIKAEDIVECCSYTRLSPTESSKQHAMHLCNPLTGEFSYNYELAKRNITMVDRTLHFFCARKFNTAIAVDNTLKRRKEMELALKSTKWVELRDVTLNGEVVGYFSTAGTSMKMTTALEDTRDVQNPFFSLTKEDASKLGVVNSSSVIGSTTCTPKLLFKKGKVIRLYKFENGGKYYNVEFYQDINKLVSYLYGIDNKSLGLNDTELTFNESGHKYAAELRNRLNSEKDKGNKWFNLKEKEKISR